jgi:hypothetical protein
MEIAGGTALKENVKEAVALTSASTVGSICQTVSDMVCGPMNAQSG